MKRDFTTACYQEFCAMLNEIKDDGWTGIRDWFGNLFGDLKHLLAEWGILGETARIEAHYQDLLERQHASKDSIKQVFEDISALDVSFGGDTPGHFGYCKKQLESFSRYIQALSGTASGGACPAAAGGFFSSYFATARTNYIMEKPFFQLFAQPEIQNLSNMQAPRFTASTFSELSNKDKKDYVRQCADLCPELAKKVDSIFSDPDWTEQEKLDIKFLIYSSPEPYRTVYLERLCNYKLILSPISVRNYSAYDPNVGTIFLEDDDNKLLYNTRGPYTTFFHEVGHLADDFAQGSGSLSCDYEVNGQNIYDCIVSDVRTYVSDYIDNICKENGMELSPEQKEQLLISLNLSAETENPEFDIAEDADLYEIHYKVKEDLHVSLSEGVNAAADDIYGSVTNNAILGSSGHRNRDYWYNEDGTPTKMQNQELWAEFFAAQITHNEEVLASMKEHFPTTYPLLEEMAQDIATK